jgi:THUMP domain-like/Methyltransferase small domain
MELEDFVSLTGPAGIEALTAAGFLADTDSLAAASALRAQGIEPRLAAAALTQAVLRRKAQAKFGPDAARLLFTRSGLEQATRAIVANRRAERLAASGATTVADLGCGIGADTIAFARAGLAVHAVDQDPAKTSLTAYNLHALGLAEARLSTMDATAVDLSDVDAVFCDPARRTASRRVFDPAAYEPPWDFVAALPTRVPRTVLKLAPGIDHGLLPDGAEGEWVSVDGDVVEATVWCGPLAEVPRRATVMRGRQIAVLTGTGRRTATVAKVGQYLVDPDGAVVRSHLVAEFAEQVDGHLADPTIAYVYTDSPVRTPFGRGYQVRGKLPIALKKLRAALRAEDVGSLTILKRGSALDVEQLRRDLRLGGSRPATIALTRVAGEPAALLLEPVP